MSDCLVLEPVGLALERFAFEIADGLPDLRDDRAVGRAMKADGLDMRADDRPLACPIVAHRLAAMDVAAIHAIGPGDIIGEHGAIVAEVRQSVRDLEGKPLRGQAHGLKDRTVGHVFRFREGKVARFDIQDAA